MWKIPIHRVHADAFWMDATEVTNARFAKFVEAAGYENIAEIAPTKDEFPTAADRSSAPANTAPAAG